MLNQDKRNSLSQKQIHFKTYFQSNQITAETQWQIYDNNVYLCRNFHPKESRTSRNTSVGTGSGWRDPSEWHWAFGAALARSLEQTCLHLKDPWHRRKCELCFPADCCACSQHAREGEVNFASFCKGPNRRK